MKGKKQSAGVLLYKLIDQELLIFLVHPGGPFWKNKDEGSWTIPKGEINENEDPLTAAIREFEEETSFKLVGQFEPLEFVKMKSGKIIHAWSLEGDVNIKELKSNDFEIEWPPKSGKIQSFPEVDKGEWFETDDAMKKINESQRNLIFNLIANLESRRHSK
jgi:predicted NUDIX family NTP pyrophosphohydrolase